MHAEGTRQAPRKLKGPLLQRGLPCVCHTPSSPSSPPLISLYRNTRRGGGEYCVTTPTPTERRIHQGDVGRLSVTRWSLAGSLAAPETRPGRRKSQPAMQKLLVNYIKTVTLTNTHRPPRAACRAVEWRWGTEKKLSALPPLEMRNIIQGPSFLSNTGGCLYSKPCLDKFGSIRRAEKRNQGKSKYIQLHFWCGGSPFQMTQSPLPFQSLRENTPQALHSSSSTLITRVTSE